jgi:hypothetical protein
MVNGEASSIRRLSASGTNTSHGDGDAVWVAVMNRASGGGEYILPARDPGRHSRFFRLDVFNHQDRAAVLKIAGEVVNGMFIFRNAAEGWFCTT